MVPSIAVHWRSMMQGKRGGRPQRDGKAPRGYRGTWHDYTRSAARRANDKEPIPTTRVGNDRCTPLPRGA